MIRAPYPKAMFPKEADLYGNEIHLTRNGQDTLYTIVRMVSGHTGAHLREPDLTILFTRKYEPEVAKP